MGNGDIQSRIIYLLLLLPPLVAAFTIHEFAHAWTGNWLGDDAARRQGRLTLDPLAHLDPFGSIMILIALFTNLPLIGWARPVPFNPRNLPHPRRDAMLIAVAGPISNVLQAGIWYALLYGFRIVAERNGATFTPEDVFGIITRQADVTSFVHMLATMMAAGVSVNLGLAAFNMIPFPPLDGHYVLEYLGPPFVSQFYDMVRPFSFIILFVLIQTPILGTALRPVSTYTNEVLVHALGYKPDDIYY